MKKIFLFLILFSLCYKVNAEVNLAKNSGSAILIEEASGKILFEKDKDKKLAPASMTKIMTVLLVMEAVDENRISLDDEVLISKRAEQMGGTQIYVKAGTNVSVLDLIKGTLIASANDAAVALAEKVGGSYENFIDMMNNRAKELGCKNTNFKNPHGLDEDGHESSAYDMALMARELIKHDLVLKISSTYDEYINVSGEKHWLVNTNKLVKFYKGIDGLKTGYTNNAGYCLTATMSKNNMRLISVVMKSDTKDNRNSDTISLMEYGYSMYGSETIFDRNVYTGKININYSEKGEYNYYLKNDVKVVVDKNTKDISYSTEIKFDDLKLPIKKGSKVGTLILSYDNKKYNYDLIVKENIKKASYLKVLINNLLDVIIGNTKK